MRGASKKTSSGSGGSWRSSGRGWEFRWKTGIGPLRMSRCCMGALELFLLAGCGFVDTSSIAVTPGLEIFAAYSLRNTGGSFERDTWFHEIDIPRVHASLELENWGVRGRL